MNAAVLETQVLMKTFALASLQTVASDFDLLKLLQGGVAGMGGAMIVCTLFWRAMRVLLVECATERKDMLVAFAKEREALLVGWAAERASLLAGFATERAALLKSDRDDRIAARADFAAERLTLLKDHRDDRASTRADYLTSVKEISTLLQNSQPVPGTKAA